MLTRTERSEEAVTSGQSLTAGAIEVVSVKRVLLAYFPFATAYIYLPAFSVITLSFNSGGLTLPFVEFTFEWYEELPTNEGLIEAVRWPVTLALVVTVITTVLATAMAPAYRYDLWGQRGLLFLLILGIITPGITYGVGTTLLLNEVLRLVKNLWPMVPVHVIWVLLFTVIVLLAGFPPVLKENEEAARVLDAGPFSRFRNMTLPQIAPTLLSVAVFVFTPSYNEAIRSLLLVGGRNTMPLEVFVIVVNTRVQSYLFALGSPTTAFSMLLLAAAGLLIVYNRWF